MRPPPEALLRRFGLRDPEWVAGTRHAQVWKVRLRSGDWGALKHYPAGHMGNEATGLLFLERAQEAGAVRVLGRSADAVLMEWLDGPSLGDLVRDQIPHTDQRLEVVDGALAEVARRAFDAAISPERLAPLAELIAPLQAVRFTAPEARAAQAMVLPLLADFSAGGGEVAALHGDLHHDNVIKTPAGLRAIDPKGLAGPPAYELANAFRHPRGCADVSARVTVIRRRAILWGEVAGCGASTQLHWAILKVLLSMLWSGEENPRERLLLRQMLKVSEDGLPD
ncbi:aminoglycoside phosphotransferase family protein [Tritonibacter mobilis]|nr:aminoglycoside phosphotransferase family protein [Tritonibacter mobilis]